MFTGPNGIGKQMIILELSSILDPPACPCLLGSANLEAAIPFAYASHNGVNHGVNGDG